MAAEPRRGNASSTSAPRQSSGSMIAKYWQAIAQDCLPGTSQYIANKFFLVWVNGNVALATLCISDACVVDALLLVRCFTWTLGFCHGGLVPSQKARLGGLGATWYISFPFVCFTGTEFDPSTSGAGERSWTSCTTSKYGVGFLAEAVLFMPSIQLPGLKWVPVNHLPDGRRKAFMVGTDRPGARR